MKTKVNKIVSLAAICGLVLSANTQAAIILGAATYTGSSGQTTSANDSPFFSTFGTITTHDPDAGIGETTSVYDFRRLTASVATGFGDTYFFLEDVQDGQLDTPGVSYTGPLARTGDGINGSNNGGSNTDDVAED